MGGEEEALKGTAVAVAVASMMGLTHSSWSSGGSGVATPPPTAIAIAMSGRRLFQETAISVLSSRFFARAFRTKSVDFMRFRTVVVVVVVVVVASRT